VYNLFLHISTTHIFCYIVINSSSEAASVVQTTDSDLADTGSMTTDNNQSSSQNCPNAPARSILQVGTHQPTNEPVHKVIKHQFCQSAI